VQVLRYNEPFNFSLLNNWAAGQATGEVLLFLNNDTEVIGADWLRHLVANAAARRSVRPAQSSSIPPAGCSMPASFARRRCGGACLSR
jgi:hypothetical protein